MPEPSPDKEADDTSQEEVVAADVKETSADPSPAGKDEGDKPESTGEKGDMLTAVKAALEPKADKAPKSDEPDPESDEKPDAAEAKAGDDPDELTEEELARLKPKTKKRIDNLLAERAERDRIIEHIGPKAEQFDKILGFVREAGLNTNEVNQLFDIGKNLKHSPRAAYDQIKPVYEQLQRMFGDVLPDDLQDKVNRGLITAPDAKALAESRTNAAVAEQTAARLRAQQEEDRNQAALTQNVESVRVETSKWEASQEKSDPDWKLKRPHVTREIELTLRRRGVPPSNAAEAIEIANKALETVNAEFKALAPRKREIKPPTDGVSNRSTTKPANLLEAARAGLAKAAG